MNLEEYYLNRFDDEVDAMGAEDCLEAIEEVVDRYLDEGVMEEGEEVEVGNALLDHLLGVLSEAGADGDFDLDELHDELGGVLEDFDALDLRRAA